MSEVAPRWQTPPPIYETPVTHATTLKSYLTLPYLLSLTWLAYPILSLLFIAFRLQLSLASAEDAVSDAKNNLLNSCKAAEHAATGAASLPRFMAIGTNKQIVDAVNGTMNGAREALILSLTVMEAIINFIIDIYRSTFLCFLELVIRGGLAILIGAVQELQQFIQNALSGIRTSIQNDVAGANSAIASAVNGINKILPFGANINVPQFNIPSLDSLNNITLPTDFEDALTKLNASIPSLDDLRSKIEAVIDTPFELVKKDINDTFLGFSFNETTLPVPQLNALSFCNDLDTGVVDDLGVALIKVARIGTIILIVLALLLLAGHCLLEWYKWRCLRQSLENTRLAWASDPTLYHVTAVSSTPTFHMTDDNLLTLHATASHPLLSRLANKISSLFHLTPSQYIHLQFFFHYIFHPPALACFLIGFFGLLSIELQLLALGPVQAKFSAQVAASVAGFGNTIADSMNASMQNQSSFYADSINGQVSTMQNGINDGLFSWVNGTTSTLNQTLVAFYADIQGAVETVFGGTILDQVAQEFVRCIIGTKVEAFENALTFLHDNLRVDLPIVNQNVLMLSQDQVGEATRPIALAAVGSGGPDDNGGVVGRLVDRYVSSLKKERVLFGIFLGLWGLVLLIALCIIFWHSYGKRWLETRHRRKWQQEQRGSGSANAAITPWSPAGTFTHPTPYQFNKEKEVGLSSFTPLAPPEKSGFFAALRKSASDTERSSDSGQSLHSDSTRDDLMARKKSSKLMAIGPKAMGREVFVRDEDAERQVKGRYGDGGEVFEVEVREEKGAAWWQRLWKRRGSDESFETDGEDNTQPKSQTETRRVPNPNLTIETNIALPKSQIDRYPVIIQDEPLVQERLVPEVPVSASSTSPELVRPIPPWTRPLPANTLPLRPKPHPNANIPQSVDSMYGPSSLTLSKVPYVKPSPAPPSDGVPIHHGFIRPVPPGTPSSPSPPSSPGGEQSMMLAPPPVRGDRLSSAPTTKHARSSSNVLVENPFATCFDDEHRISPTPPAKHLSMTNPFADVGTPRAV